MVSLEVEEKGRDSFNRNSPREILARTKKLALTEHSPCVGAAARLGFLEISGLRRLLSSSRLELVTGKALKGVT